MKKVLISIIAILLSVLILIIIYAKQNVNFRILIRESVYKNTSNTENLGKLCLDISMTDNYEKKIKYFPILLIDENALDWMTKNIVSSSMNSENMLDCLQIEYCFAYLLLEDYEKFSEEFHRLFNDFRSGTEKYSWLMAIVLNGEYSTEQLKAILEAVKDAYYLEDQNISGINNCLSNLNTQIDLCNILQDSQGKSEAQSQIDTIIQGLR